MKAWIDYRAYKVTISNNLESGRRLQSKGTINQELFCQSKNLVVLTVYNISRAWDSQHPLAIKVEMKMSERTVHRLCWEFYPEVGTKA